MSDTQDQLMAGIEAMLDGNRVKFGEIVSGLMAQKAAEAIDDISNEMEPYLFDFNELEDDITDDEREDSSEDEEDVEIEEVEESEEGSEEE